MILTLLAGVAVLNLVTRPPRHMLANLEAREEIESPLLDLQSSACPLGHRAILFNSLSRTISKCRPSLCKSVALPLSYGTKMVPLGNSAIPTSAVWVRRSASEL